MTNIITFIIVYLVTLFVLFITDAIGVFLLIVFLFIFAAIVTLWTNHNAQKGQNIENIKWGNTLKALPDFNATKHFFHTRGVLAIDSNQRKIAFSNPNGTMIVLPFERIVACEIIEDGVTTYKKSSVLKRAVVGGILAGGAGAIIGGLTGSEKETKETNKIDLKILISDSQNPTYTIEFFDKYNSIDYNKPDKDDFELSFMPVLQRSKKAINEWKDTLSVIIDQNDKANKSASQNTNDSIVNDLHKLNELKEKGVLSDEEFQEQKRRLLNRM